MQWRTRGWHDTVDAMAFAWHAATPLFLVSSVTLTLLAFSLPSLHNPENGRTENQGLRS